MEPSLLGLWTVDSVKSMSNYMGGCTWGLKILKTLRPLGMDDVAYVAYPLETVPTLRIIVPICRYCSNCTRKIGVVGSSLSRSLEVIEIDTVRSVPMTSF